MHSLKFLFFVCIASFCVISTTYAEKIKIGFIEEIDTSVDVPSVIQQNLKESIRCALVNSGKFDVFDRNQKDLSRLVEEMKFSDERLGRVDINDSKKAEFGKISGIEYIVLLGINDFLVGQEKSKFQKPLADEKSFIRLGVSLRLLNSSTGKIQLEKDIIEKQYSSIKLTNEEFDIGLSNKTINLLTRKITRQIIEELYPILILEKTGASAFINCGKDAGIVVGEEFEVYATKNVLDDVTLNNLAIEKSVGKVKVIRISPKTSEVEIIEDFGIDKGCIIRSQDSENQPVKKNISENIQKKKNGDDW